MRKKVIFLVILSFGIINLQGQLKIRSIKNGTVVAPPYAEISEFIAHYLDGKTFRVKISNFPANPTGGASGQGFSSSTKLKLEDWGVLELRSDGQLVKEKGFDYLREGELVAIQAHGNPFGNDEPIREADNRERGGDASVNIQLKTILKHNVTRGKGNFQHETPEYLNTTLRIPLDTTPEKFKTVWNSLFDVATAEDLSVLLHENPSGVLVEELKEGMTPSQVESMMGPPDRKARMGDKII